MGIDIDIDIDIFQNHHIDINIDIDIFNFSISISISISIFFKSVDISTIDIRYRYIEQGYSAQSSKKLCCNRCILKYDKMQVNSGSGLTLEKGIFKAPREGNYYFQFHGLVGPGHE